MAFESEHGMTTDGAVGPKLWSALFRAAKTGDRNANGYTYAVASKSLPESLTIWHDGRVVFRSLANTGIPVSPTVDGTFPVYQKYRFQIMRGTNPDGSSYADPVSYVSYFNGGDAVHYFPRGSYGSQQSLGCVELSYSSAQQAYPYLTYGSLVTVAG
jgi:lipoprotein-anchoring transpeptidase ErfK/SrfK